MKKFLTVMFLFMAIFSYSQSPKEVTIGNQVWMQENLNVGVMTSSTQTNNGIVEKYCYNNVESNCNLYGGLYDWEEAMNYVHETGTQGICPDGWRLPTKADVEELYTYLEGQTTCAPKLKKVNKWEFLRSTCTPKAVNTSGFSAIPSGTRYSTGYFTGNTICAYYWTSNEVVEYEASWYFGLRYCSSDMKVGMFWTNDFVDGGQAASIRCIKN